MRPVLTASQVREVDQRTIREEPIASIDLMERAARACFHRFMEDMRMGLPPKAWGAGDHRITVLAGPGNNGGDGLAIARMMHRAALPVLVLLLASEEDLSPDARINLQRAREADVPLSTVPPGSDMPRFAQHEVVVDALFGTGLSRPLSGWHRDVVQALNASGAWVLSIDQPSGMSADVTPIADEEAIVHAARTYTLGCIKPALLLPENSRYIGEWSLLHIGLLLDDPNEAEMAMVEARDVASWLPMRPSWAHKGTFGHALIVAGGQGMWGAAVIAAKAAVRSGAGLVTAAVPGDAVPTLHATCPEAMTIPHPALDALDRFKAMAIGPGLGTTAQAHAMLSRCLVERSIPMVLDADALNLIAKDDELLSMLPAGAVLTPHPGEFDRLCGPGGNTAERLEKAREFARRHAAVMVLKGGPTVTVLPDGTLRWNSTGNAGMARGGSGDALTGLICGLLAQGLAPDRAAMAGVYLHGLAGDIAAAAKGMDAMTITDLVEALPKAYAAVRTASVQ